MLQAAVHPTDDRPLDDGGGGGGMAAIGVHMAYARMVSVSKERVAPFAVVTSLCYYVSITSCAIAETQLGANGV